LNSENRFRSDATIRRAILDEEKYVYLFTEGNIVNLMHPSNYEQITINLDLLGEKKIYLQDNMKGKGSILNPSHLVSVIM
jgi:elongation factor P